VRVSRERELVTGAPEAISNAVKSTMPTGTGCARTTLWIHPSTPLTSAPLGGVSVQIMMHARTMGSATNHAPQYTYRRSASVWGRRVDRDRLGRLCRHLYFFRGQGASPIWMA